MKKLKIWKENEEMKLPLWHEKVRLHILDLLGSWMKKSNGPFHLLDTPDTFGLLYISPHFGWSLTHSSQISMVHLHQYHLFYRSKWVFSIDYQRRPFFTDFRLTDNALFFENVDMYDSLLSQECGFPMFIWDEIFTFLIGTSSFPSNILVYIHPTII